MLHFMENRQQPLQMMFWLVWMDIGNSRQLGDHFIHSWIVLLSTRAQWIEASIYAEISS